MNKRAFELSLNMIVMVILALAFLGVGLWIIRIMIPDVPVTPDPCDIYPPTRQYPVCVQDEISLGRGDTKTVTVAFYNDEDADILETVLPTLTCSPSPDGNTLDFQTSSTGKFLEIAETEDYQLIITIPKDAARGSYPCNLRLSSTQESVTLVIE